MGAALGVLFFAGVFVFWWAVGSDGGTEGTPVTLDAQQVQAGRDVYQVSCAVCHGPGGAGDPDWQEQNPDGTFPPPPHDNTGHTWRHGDGLLYRIISEGGSFYETPGFTSAMPAFGDQLTLEEIRAVITYYKSLWDPEERAFQARASQDDPFPQ